MLHQAPRCQRSNSGSKMRVTYRIGGADVACSSEAENDKPPRPLNSFGACPTTGGLGRSE